MRRRPTPLGAVIRGLVAGAGGTLAMDLVWYRRYRAGGGESPFAQWEFSTEADSYDKAGASAEFGRLMVEAYLQRELPEESAGLMSNAVHWTTGIGWGVIHGIVFGVARRSRQPVVGVLTGAAAWAASYLILVPAGVYRPVASYDKRTLWKDFTAHLVFGLGTGSWFGLLAPRRR